MTQPSADVSTGSGWVPWLTWGSCCGSPSRSSREAARRHGDGGGERELARLVDDEKVEASARDAPLVARSPTPCRRRRTPLAACSAVNSAHAVLGDRSEGEVVGGRVLRRLRDQLARDAGIHDAAQHVLDHGVRLRDDPDLEAALAHEPGDHVRPDIRLARAGRALHREVTAVEIDDGADDRIDVVAGGCGKSRIRPLSLSKGARRAPAQDVGGRVGGKLGGRCDDGIRPRVDRHLLVQGAGRRRTGSGRPAAVSR